jgi:hypothetical protein
MVKNDYEAKGPYQSKLNTDIIAEIGAEEAETTEIDMDIGSTEANAEFGFEAGAKSGLEADNYNAGAVSGIETEGYEVGAELGLEADTGIGWFDENGCDIGEVSLGDDEFGELLE